MTAALLRLFCAPKREKTPCRRVFCAGKGVKMTSVKTQKLTGLGIFTAIIVVLQVFATFVKFGPVSITLALAPIIIGAAVYGAAAGAYLGFVFSLVVFIAGVCGWDGGFTLYLMSLNAAATTIMIFLKGTAAGYLAGLIYRALRKKSEKGAVVVAGVACPCINTGIFLATLFIFLFPALEHFAAGENVVKFALTGLVGINFIVELVVNIALSSVITYIIRLRRKSGKVY